MAVKLGRRATLDRFLRSIARDRPRRARSDHDGAFIIALFQQSLLPVCPSPFRLHGHRRLGMHLSLALLGIHRVARLGAFGLLRSGRLALHLALRILDEAATRRSRNSSSRLADAERPCSCRWSGCCFATQVRTGVLACGAALSQGPAHAAPAPRK